MNYEKWLRGNMNGKQLAESKVLAQKAFKSKKAFHLLIFSNRAMA